MNNYNHQDLSNQCQLKQGMSPETRLDWQMVPHRLVRLYLNRGSTFECLGLVSILAKDLGM